MLSMIFYLAFCLLTKKRFEVYFAVFLLFKTNHIEVAIQIEEYVPQSTPTMSGNENSLIDV